MFPDEFLGHCLPKLPSDLQGMVVVETGIDARPKYFVHQVARVLERMLVESVRESSAVNRYVYPRASEVARNRSSSQ